MENGSTTKRKWAFQGNPELNTASEITIRGVLAMLKTYLNQSDSRPVIPLGHGDPSAFSCFRTSHVAEDAIANAIHSVKFTAYSPTLGLLPARRAVAEYLSQDLPNKISPDDVFMTVGCTQAIQTIITVLADSKANILLPKPGYPYYEAFAQSCHLEVRHFDLLPEKDWEVDLDAVEALADENTAAMVIINPGNPCGNVFTYQHLQKVAETARKLGILVIADEVYGHIAFGKNPFVPMGVFGSITPVITLGSLSKRWIVPGWRLGWLVINDPNGILKKHGVTECITRYLNISSNPPTLIQGAVPDILGKTKEDFFLKIINTIKEAANSCYEGINDIPGVICPSEPEGSMFVMVKLDLSVLEDIKDDLDFCVKLAKEESVIILPGISVGLKNWLRLTFAIEPSSLEDGIKRLKAFCKRHSKKALSINRSLVHLSNHRDQPGSCFEFFKDNHQASGDMEDPSSRLISEFLNKQKYAGGEMALDMDLEMDELRNGTNRRNVVVNQNAESPIKGVMINNESVNPNSWAPNSRKLRVSFQQPDESSKVT
ncbi:hypothetical protein L6452_15632 [Arctium lappa]|uniref:Uncharacterized protein n=1 Tax=Arctium lappa TaxID=4217 RepID=A0ACB9CP82_ARCLA|nr:hypothetical protein L6452_15632 [Arctium lappa]